MFEDVAIFRFSILGQATGIDALDTSESASIDSEIRIYSGLVGMNGRPTLVDDPLNSDAVMKMMRCTKVMPLPTQRCPD
jgi:hypothetical protein